MMTMDSSFERLMTTDSSFERLWKEKTDLYIFSALVRHGGGPFAMRNQGPAPDAVLPEPEGPRLPLTVRGYNRVSGLAGTPSHGMPSDLSI